MSDQLKLKLLIVDDDEDIRAQMKWALAHDYDVLAAHDRQSTVQAYAEDRPLVMLLDLGLPPSPGTPDEGFAVVGGLLEMDRSVKIIIISGQSERRNAFQAIGKGAYDFLSKPVDVEELQ